MWMKALPIYSYQIYDKGAPHIFINSLNCVSRTNGAKSAVGSVNVFMYKKIHFSLDLLHELQIGTYQIKEDTNHAFVQCVTFVRLLSNEQWNVLKRSTPNFGSSPTILKISDRFCLFLCTTHLRSHFTSILNAYSQPKLLFSLPKYQN